MSTNPLHDLEALQESNGATDDADLKRSLARIGMEVNARLQTASSNSADFMNEVVKTLKRVASTAHAELRINCLIDASHFFYLIGQPFNAIEPATDAERGDLALDQPLRGLRQRPLRLADTDRERAALGLAGLDQQLAEEMRFAGASATVNPLVARGR